MREFINNYFEKLKTTVDRLDRREIETFIDVLLKARDRDSTIFTMGNGGSASTASHFVCDLAKGTICSDEKRFKVVCLNDNIASMMAYANDMSYDDIFVEQLKNQFKPGDVVIGISGSGNSKNVIKAIEYANENNGVSIGITGFSGGILKQISMYSVNANIDDMQISEDVHMSLVHLCMRAILTQNTVKERV